MPDAASPCRFSCRPLDRSLVYRAASLILVWVLLLAVMLRIQTYVVAADASTYVVYARGILEAPWGSAQMREALTSVVPGYPLILAAAIKLFGLFAPYWVNFVFGLAFFGVYALLLRRLLDDARAEAIVLVTTFFVFITGYYDNANYLLYSFRELPAFFFIILGMLALAPAAGLPSPARCFGAGLLFVAASGVREPSVCAAVGPVLWLVSRPRAGGWRRAGAFLLPFVLAAGVVLAMGLAMGQLHSKQWLGWLEPLQHRDLRRFLLDYGKTARGLLGFVADELRVVGLALLAVGVWKLRRSARPILFFLLSAVLFFLFYSSFFSVHRRYFLSILLFLCPFAGYGLHAVIEWARQGVRAVLKRDAGDVLRAAALLALVALLVRFLPALIRFGPPVSRAQAAAFREGVRALSPTGGVFYVERKCRDVRVAVNCLTDSEAEQPTSKKAKALLDGPGPLFYLEPLNDACFVEAALDASGVPADERLRSVGDLVPVKDTQGAARELRLGEGRYAVHRVVPWSRRSVEQEVEGDPEERNVLWLDFRDTPRDGAKKVTLVSDDLRVLYTWKTDGGNGLQGFVLPAGEIEPQGVRVRVDSEFPVPADFLAGVEAGKKPMVFLLNQHRRLSAMDWFRPPFATGPEDDNHAVGFTDGGRLRIPWPIGGDYRKLAVDLSLRSKPAVEKKATLEARVGGEVVAREELDLAGTGHELVFAVPRRPGVRTLDVELSISPTNQPVLFQVRSIALAVR